MNRYSAKLLFQFRVDDKLEGDSRTCEERIITFMAPSAEVALIYAKEKGRDAVTDYANEEGQSVYFEFVGVLDLLELGIECEPEEVWYDVVERHLPITVPDESELNAFREDPATQATRPTVKRN